MTEYRLRYRIARLIGQLAFLATLGGFVAMLMNLPGN